MLDRFAFRKKAVKKGVHSAVCVECNRGGYTEWTLRMHLRDAHKYIACKACRQIFASDAEHRCPLQNIACDRCPKRFASVAGWNLHQKKVHGGLRLYCHICGLQLANGNTLRIHMEVRHGIMPPPSGHRGTGEPGIAPPSYTCHKCGKQMKSRYTLKEHERRQHGGKFRGSAPCKLCSRIFYSGFSLKRHMATVHRGQKEDGGGRSAELDEDDEKAEYRYH